MRVLHAYKIYRPDVEGGIPFAIGTLSQLGDEGISNRILVARDRGLRRRCLIDSVPVDARASFGTVFSTPIAPAFPAALLKEASNADILVHHAPFPLTDLAIPWLPKRIALIVYWHADIVKYSILKAALRPALRNTLRRADKIIVADERNISDSEILRDFADKCVVVPFGVDADFWSIVEASDVTRIEELRRRKSKMVVAIGRLVPYKGFDILLQAIKDIDCELVLIGQGPLAQELEVQAQRLGIADRVSFTGSLPTGDCKAYLHSAKVLAFPSISSAEAFGIVQLEAMACGCPIVNTALDTAVPHVARHNLEALTVPPGDPQALAAALRQIINDPPLRERLGEAGRQRVFAEFSRDRYLSRILSIYKDVTADR
ncbi:glycosyltransferase [Rhodopseudomonas palustris]